MRETAVTFTAVEDLEIGDLQTQIGTEQEISVFVFFLVELGVSLHRDDELELPPRHTLQLSFQFVRITTKVVNDSRVLDTIEELDSLGVVHHTGDGPVECLGMKEAQICLRRVNSGAALLKPMKSKVRRPTLPFSSLAKGLTQLNMAVFTARGVLDEVLPFDGVELFEVFQERDASVLVLGV